MRSPWVLETSAVYSSILLDVTVVCSSANEGEVSTDWLSRHGGGGYWRRQTIIDSNGSDK